MLTCELQTFASVYYESYGGETAMGNETPL